MEHIEQFFFQSSACSYIIIPEYMTLVSIIKRLGGLRNINQGMECKLRTYGRITYFVFPSESGANGYLQKEIQTCIIRINIVADMPSKLHSKIY